MLKNGRSVTIPVKGSSMLPFIREGEDKVILEGIEDCTPDGKERIKVNAGDIVLFRHEGKHLMHRVISIGTDHIVLQGDGVIDTEERCLRDDICGKAVRILKGGTKPMDPYSTWMRLQTLAWIALRPLRRYLLFIIKVLQPHHNNLRPHHDE